MKKIVLAFLIGLIAVFLSLGIYNIKKTDEKTLYLSYKEFCLVSSNGNYTAWLDGGTLRVYDRGEKEEHLLSLSTLDIMADQVTVGNDGVYLLRFGTSEKSSIYKFDFDMKNIGMAQYDYTRSILCKDGKLFMDNNANHDNFELPFNLLRGIVADTYIEEEKFGQKPKKINSDKVGTIQFFPHGKAAYSTEPMLDDYGGVSEFRINDYEDVDSQIGDLRRKQERKDCQLVLDAIQDKGKTYYIYEYQDGSFIYGVCNVFAEKFFSDTQEPYTRRDTIKYTVAYCINPKTNKLKVLAKEENTYGIIATKDSFVTYEQNQIKKMNFDNCRTKQLTIPDAKDISIHVYPNYILIGGITNSIILDWNLNKLYDEKENR